MLIAQPEPKSMFSQSQVVDQPKPMAITVAELESYDPLLSQSQTQGPP